MRRARVRVEFAVHGHRSCRPAGRCGDAAADGARACGRAHRPPEAQAEIERLRLIVKKLQRSQFGRRAERLDDDQLQLGFEDLGADIARVEARLPTATAAKRPKSQDERPSLPAHLPREDMRLDIEHQACPCCGGALHLIGETVSEMLDHVPARLRVIRICRPRYGCRACGTIHQAPAPERPIAKGLASPALLAHVLVSKYCDHLPLYRQSQIFARQGVELDRSTLANWVGGAVLVAGAAAGTTRRACLRLADSCSPTTRRSRCSIPAAAAPRPAGSGSMPVMTGPGMDPIRRQPSISTVPIAGPSVPPLIWRSSKASFRSTAIPDSSGSRDGGDIQLAACWAHARRKFYEVHQATGSPVAAEALRRIAELYAIESDHPGPDGRGTAGRAAHPSRAAGRGDEDLARDAAQPRPTARRPRRCDPLCADPLGRAVPVPR